MRPTPRKAVTMQPWFKDMISGLESLSLDSEADRETLWMALESTLSGMHTTRVNELISDEAKNLAYAYEVKHKITQNEYTCEHGRNLAKFCGQCLADSYPGGN